VSREIRFRAWDREKEAMYFDVQNVYDCAPEGTDAHFQAFGQFISGGKWIEFSEHQAGRFALMQYTGLKDKNGKEIYEGDLLRELNHWPASYTTKKHGTVYLPVQFKDGGYFYGEDEVLSGHDTGHLEVIGNIYENPELLK
jgi:uncharacterized phage protein (TIGR01671 family)